MPTELRAARSLPIRTSGGALAGLLVVLAAMVALALPTVGQAYTHNQPCNHAPYSECYDTRGINPNPWVYVGTTMDDMNDVPGICAKAVTSPGGNVKSGSTCDSNVYAVQAFIAASPQSVAYGYWGDAGCHCWGARAFIVSAYT